jgi:hypothetical protein
MNKLEKAIQRHTLSFDHFMNEYYKFSDNNKLVVSSIKQIGAAYFHNCRKNKVDMGIENMSIDYLTHELLSLQNKYTYWGYVLHANDPIRFDASGVFVNGIELTKLP